MFDNSPCPLETEARVRDTGLDVLDIEVMLLTPERDVKDFKRVFETAQRLGARNALTLIDIAERSLAVEKFAQLCELAALFDISCALEFAAWLGVGSIQAANAIVSEAAQANGALLLDPFHLIRSGGKVSDIAAIDPARIRYAQFCSRQRDGAYDHRGYFRRGTLWAPVAGRGWACRCASLLRRCLRHFIRSRST